MDPLICACQSNIPISVNPRNQVAICPAPRESGRRLATLCFEITRELPTVTRPVCEVHVSLLDIHLACASESFVKRQP